MHYSREKKNAKLVKLLEIHAPFSSCYCVSLNLCPFYLQGHISFRRVTIDGSICSHSRITFFIYQGLLHVPLLWLDLLEWFLPWASFRALSASSWALYSRIILSVSASNSPLFISSSWHSKWRDNVKVMHYNKNHSSKTTTFHPAKTIFREVMQKGLLY